MKHLSLQRVSPLLGVLLFMAALWTIHHELQTYHYHEVIGHVSEIPLTQIAFALGLTALNYLTLTGYDTLAARYIRHTLPYQQIALTSFISYAFSHTVGLALLSSSSVRYRLYSLRGLSGVDIATIIVFTSVTFWLGFCTLSGIVFLCVPILLPAAIHLPFSSMRVLGAFLLMVPLGYVGWSARARAPVQIRQTEFAVPTAPLASAQVLVSTVDWTLAGAVLYVLLPSHAFGSYPQFLAIFLVAQIAGIMSQVPGGLGVFETVILLSIAPDISAAAVLGALFVYRFLYYLVPFTCAVVLFGGYELRQKQETMRSMAAAAHGWVSLLVPDALAFTTFLGGAMLLFSGATPGVTSRLHWLAALFPLPVIEVSHFLGSMIGVALLLLARGLQLRLDVAYTLTMMLLLAGSLASLLKGFDYEEALVLSAMVIALLPCRAQFYRKASLINQRFTVRWIAAIALALCGSLWLGWFSYKHLEYSQELWWQFALEGNAPRFLRASVAVLAVTVFVAMARLLRPSPPDPTLPKERDLETAKTIIAQAHNIEAHLALLGDKQLLFNDEHSAFIMYGVEGRSWVALGDPVGPEDEATELAWSFRELCDRHDGWSVFYQVRPLYLPLYLDLGLSLLKLGEQGRVRLESFSLDGKSRKSFRLICNRLDKQDCVFDIVAPDGVPALLPELQEISAQWLGQKHTREKGFSLGFFDPRYIQRGPVALVRQDRKIVAFANLWLGAAGGELSPDLMRYRPDAPDDVMEYLFLQLMLWGKAQGYQWCNLGMAPLSGLEDHALAPLWNRLGAFMFRHGEHFYNFQGVRRYKEKFAPEWEPCYLASPGGLALPRILTNITALIAGGLKGVVSK
jgi:phosphatidylglycerol lysyltransferase